MWCRQFIDDTTKIGVRYLLAALCPCRTAFCIRSCASVIVLCVQIAAAGERSTAKRTRPSLKCYAGKTEATVKSKVPNAGNAGWYGYAGKTSATFKTFISNADNFAGGCKGYAVKAATTSKSGSSNGGNAVSYGYTGKGGATLKSGITNAGNAVRYGYAGKGGANLKSASPNDVNVVRYC